MLKRLCASAFLVMFLFVCMFVLKICLHVNKLPIGKEPLVVFVSASIKMKSFVYGSGKIYLIPNPTPARQKFQFRLKKAVLWLFYTER